MTSDAYLVVIHPRENYGASFKLLGCMMDVNFRMHTCIGQLLSRARFKFAVILRTKAYCSRSELIVQFKVTFEALIEMHCETYLHVASTLLDQGR